MSSAASGPSAPISASVVTTVKTKRLKRNSDDIGWDFGELVNEDNPDIIKCKFCPHVVTSGIYRLKCHVAGRKGVKSCSSAPPEAIKKCKDALDQVRVTKKARKEKEQEVRDSVNLDADGDEDEVAQSEALDEVGGSARRNVGPMDKFTFPMEPSDLMNTRTTVQQKQVSAIVKKRQHALKRFIAKWVYVHGIPFHAINNEEFDRLIEAAGRYGPGGKKPNQHELREKLLHEEVEDTKKMLKVQEEDWAKSGCSIMTDAWTDRKRRSIMNLCLHCSVGISFLESKEVSDESHTGELIFSYVDGCIDRVGPDNVVQVVTDNASNNMAAKNLLMVKRPHIFWTSCATHTLNLMLEGVGKLSRFKKTFDQAKALTIFIYAHHRTLALMRRFTKKRDIVRPGVTRFASNFLTLQSLLEKKDQLRAMSQSSEWKSFNQVKKSAKGVQATSTLVRGSFWNGVALLLRVFEPLVKVLRMVDSDIKPSTAFIYGDIQKAKKKILVGIGNLDKTGKLYGSVMEIVHTKMKDRLDSPLHLAAYYLNPYYSYNDPSIFGDQDIVDGFFTCV